ncbi:hypothetical protein AGMMS50229_00540 [Campylobacterota bacterium]|nr:hypothetical protein AGMMS50229_00540 [Campylobacterota bacterium]
MKNIKFLIKNKLREIAQLIASREEVELLMRAVIGGGALSAILFRSYYDIIVGITLVVLGYCIKVENNKRKERQ